MSAKTKKFDIGTILTMTTGRFVCGDIGKVYELANFMTGESIFTHQLPRVGKVIEAEIKRQLPWTDSPEMQFQVGELILMLERVSDADLNNLIVGWVSKQAAAYGEQHKVEAFGKDSPYESIDPIFEAVGMMGGDPDRVIKVEVKK